MLDAIRGLKVAVIGDVMLDEYLVGAATRISPEAPVMVLRQSERRAVAGGAANVGRNIVALGGQATVIGLRGADESGDTLERALAGLEHRLIVDAQRPTTRKTRIVADRGQQIVRLDDESTDAVTGPARDDLLQAAESAVKEADLVILSDYRKGALVPELCRLAIESARGPVFANGKPGSGDLFRGATMVSLNRAEAAAELGHPIREAVADAAALRNKLGAAHFLLTLGEDGMATEAFHVPAVSVEVADVAGAGDTTLAAAAMMVAARGFGPEAFAFAASVAAAVVRHHGVAVPTPDDLLTIDGRS